MSAYIYAYVHMYIYMHACIHRLIYIYIHVHACMCRCTLYRYRCMHAKSANSCLYFLFNKRTKLWTFLKFRFSPHPYLWCAPPRPPHHPSPAPSPLAKCSCEPEAGYSQLHFARGEGEGEGSPYQGPQDAAGAAVSPPPSFSASCDGRVC